MGIIRNITLALAAAGTLGLGSVALAQDAQKPQAKSDAQHRGHGMERMREMRGGCHGEGRQKHEHS